MIGSNASARPRTASTPARLRALSAAAGVALAGSAVVAAAPAQAQTTVWDAVAQCESGGNWSINTGNGYYGGLQFSSSTWRAYGGGEFAAYAHQTSRENQIRVAQRVLLVQGPGAWPTCGRKAGLTVANGSIPLEPPLTPAPAVPQTKDVKQYSFDGTSLYVLSVSTADGSTKRMYTH
ncbi:MAG: transglycosylase family protein [Actinomycetales bacterium]